jgi:hypothetical protein
LSSAGNIGIFNNGEARYHLYNNGSVTEWVFGQKNMSQHDFALSSLVSNVETDRLIITNTGDVGIGTTKKHVQTFPNMFF